MPKSKKSENDFLLLILHTVNKLTKIVAKNISGLIPFKKGDPRINRKGAPKRIVALKKLLEATLGAEIMDDDSIRKSDLGVIISALARAAKKGNFKAADILLNRVYGSPKVNIEVDNSKPIINVQHNVIDATELHKGTGGNILSEKP